MPGPAHGDARGGAERRAARPRARHGSALPARGTHPPRPAAAPGKGKGNKAASQRRREVRHRHRKANTAAEPTRERQERERDEPGEQQAIGAPPADSVLPGTWQGGGRQYPHAGPGPSRAPPPRPAPTFRLPRAGAVLRAPLPSPEVGGGRRGEAAPRPAPGEAPRGSPAPWIECRGTSPPLRRGARSTSGDSPVHCAIGGRGPAENCCRWAWRGARPPLPSRPSGPAAVAQARWGSLNPSSLRVRKGLLPRGWSLPPGVAGCVVSGRAAAGPSGERGETLG